MLLRYIGCLLFVGMLLADPASAQLAPLSAFGKTQIVLGGEGFDLPRLQGQLAAKLKQRVVTGDPGSRNVITVWVSLSERSTYIRCTTSDGRSQQSTIPRNDETLTDDVVQQLRALNPDDAPVQIPKANDDPPYPLVAFKPTVARKRLDKLDDLKDWMAYEPKPKREWTGVENAAGLGDPK